MLIFFITELHRYNEHDAVIFCGDYNGHIRNMADVDINVDVYIANRTIINHVKNAYDDALIDFVVDG